MRLIKVIFTLIIFAEQPEDVDTQCQTPFFGENNFGGSFSSVDSNTDFGYLMSHTDYIVDCCGIVNEWKAEYAGVTGTRTINFQVWRSTTGTTYELVGQNSETVNADGIKTTPVGQSNRITIKPGDKFGWWSSGTDIVVYRTAVIISNNEVMTLTSKVEGNTQDWGTSTTENGRGYAVKMSVTNNNSPHFTNLPDTIPIQATTAFGTSIFDVSFDDIDTYDVSSLTISMTANPDYSFDASTYVASTASSFSTSRVDTIEFKVVDQCGNTATATLTVSITNQAPEIVSLPSAETMREDETIETLLHTINVTDPEGSTVTCSFAPSVPTTTQFMVRLIPSTTDYGIYSKASPSFDYSTQSSYSLTVDCTDGEYTDSGTFTVLLTQNTPPVFLNLQNSTSISTTDPIGTSVFDVLVSDTDDVMFTMTCIPATCPFQIYDSGAILVSEDISDLTIVGYDLSIFVSDGRNTVGPKILTVTIADINDPVIISNLPVSTAVVENTLVGTSIYTVSYTDEDKSQSRTISMTSSPATGLSYFNIDSTTGELTSSGALNYETMGTNTFVFDITVSDPITSDTRSLTIEVTNENEAPSFSQSSYIISAMEGAASTIIGTPVFSITDPDAGDTVTLTNDCGAHTGYFLMDSSSGQVSYQSDYDIDTGLLPGEVSCIVTATDILGLTDTADLLITIVDSNDNTPVFSPTNYVFHVNYYAPVGTSVGKVTATDADVGSDGVFTYSIDQSHLGAEYFAIDSAGEITIKTTPEGSALGYGLSVAIVTTASDVGALTGTANVTIIISETTTRSTTTATERYLRFIEDSRNIAWLAVCVIFLLISIFVLIYVIYTCKGKKGCSRFRKNFSNQKKTHVKISRYRRQSFESNRLEDSRNHFRRAVKRPAPPPKEFQPWRNEVV